MAREVTFDLLGEGDAVLAKAIATVQTTNVQVTRAASVVFPSRKAHVSVSGSDTAVDAAYEALVAAFPGVTVEVREKEFPWHWEKNKSL